MQARGAIVVSPHQVSERTAKDEIDRGTGVGRRQTGAQFSRDAILAASWRDSSVRQYKIYVRKWVVFCGTRSADPYEANEVNILDYLTALLNKGASYSVINTARSALSSFLFVKGISVGKCMSVHERSFQSPSCASTEQRDLECSSCA